MFVNSSVNCFLMPFSDFLQCPLICHRYKGKRENRQRVKGSERGQTHIVREDEIGSRTFSRTKYAVSPCEENKRKEARTVRTSSCSEPKIERIGRVGRSRVPLCMYHNVSKKIGQ